MISRRWIVGAVLAVLVIAALIVRGMQDPSDVHTAKPERVDRIAADSTANNAVDTEHAVERQVVETARPVLIAADGEHVRGLVLDVDGTPRAGVELEQHIGKERRLVARSGEDGTFEASLEPVEGTLTTADGEWACVTPCKLEHARRAENHVLVVARAIALRGRVVDRRGNGVANASIGVRLTSELRPNLPKSFSFAPDWLAATATNSNGEFALESVAQVLGARLLASREPLVPVGQALPAGDAPLLIVLDDPDVARFICGVVVDQSETPLTEVRVTFGSQRSITAADGEFRITLDERDLADRQPELALLACLEGYQPRAIENFGRVVFTESENPPFQHLVLIAPDLAIRGHVVDSDGKPVPAAVRLAGERAGYLKGEPQCSQEQWMDLDFNHGEFGVRGLRDREYELEFQPFEKAGLRFVSEPIRAGTSDVVLRIPTETIAPLIRGRVVAPDGQGVGCAKLAVVWKRDCEASDAMAGRCYVAQSTTSDSTGAFELHDVITRDAWLVVEVSTVAPQCIDLANVNVASELRVVAQRLSAFVVTGLETAVPDLHVVLLDEHGAEPWIDPGNFAPIAQGDCISWRHQLGSPSALITGEGRYGYVVSRGEVVLASGIAELVAGKTFTVDL